MKIVELMPRLTNAGVQSLLDDYAANGIPKPGSVREDIEGHSHYVSYAASGGNLNPELAVTIASQLRKIAEENGWPDSNRTQDRTSFDLQAASWLACESSLATGEALRDDVWAYMTTILAPDIVAWRFPGLKYERFRGGVRNAFQRLWMRGVALDLGQESGDRWLLLRELTEEAMVQIFERPSLSADKIMARKIAEEWCVAKSSVDSTQMEDIMRSAVKLIRLRNEIIDLAALAQDEITREIRGLFHAAASIIQQKQI